MLTGVIIYTASKSKDRLYMRQVDMWVKAFKGEGVKLTPVDSIRAKFAIKSAPEIVKFVFMYTRDISLAQEIEAFNIPVINSPNSCLYCDDKSISQARFEMAHIPTPITISIPPMPSDKALENFGVLKGMMKKQNLSYPLVIKERQSIEGNGIYLVNNEKQLIFVVKKLAPNGLLVQEYIGDNKGLSYKIYVAGKKPYASIIEYNKKDFRSNGPGTKMIKSHDVPYSAKLLAKRAAVACKTAIASVDIISDKKGHLYVIGIDGNPRTLEAEKITKRALTVKAAMYIIKNIPRYKRELKERKI